MAERLSPKIILLGGQPTHWCPGCKQLHRICVNCRACDEGEKGVTMPLHVWDSNYGEPTFRPAIKIMCSIPRNSVEQEHPVLYVQCHYLITQGMLDFREDCIHNFAGQLVPMPDIPDWVK